MSDATKQALSEKHKAAFASGARNHPRAGVALTDETKAKISASLAGRRVGSSAAIKAIATKREKGMDLAFFRGRQHDEETKRIIGEKTALRFSQNREATREPMLARIAEAGLVLLNRVDEPVFHLKCLACEYEFTRHPQMFQPSKFHSLVCDQCHPVSPVSEAETEVANFVASLMPKGTVILRSDCESIAPLELDIVIPEKGIAIEYCGLYWHSELAGRGRFYHRAKLEKCQNAGIRLITIFEDEWLTKRAVVESMLSNLIGANRQRVDARKCEVVELSNEAAREFVGSNHVQGAGRSSVKYGLVHSGVIVAAMTFSDTEISRRGHDWEINRFCTAPGTTVRGGAGKLFNEFVRKISPQKVVSYADLRWGTGDVYGKIGFRLSGNTVPGYWYVKPNEMKRHHRYALRKQANEPKDVTEWQLRKEAGWNRIWDCGHAKWTWELT